MRDKEDELTPNERAWLRFLREVGYDSDPTAIPGQPCAECNSCGASARLGRLDGCGWWSGSEEWPRCCASPGPLGYCEVSGVALIRRGENEFWYNHLPCIPT